MSTAAKHIVRVVLERVCTSDIDEYEAQRLLEPDATLDATRRAWRRWGWLLDDEERRERSLSNSMRTRRAGEFVRFDEGGPRPLCRVDRCSEDVVYVTENHSSMLIRLTPNWSSASV